jgi:hypothetical protein
LELTPTNHCSNDNFGLNRNCHDDLILTKKPVRLATERVKMD